MTRAIPSPTALDKYSVNNSSGMDVIYQPIYDYQTYSSAGQTSLNFFQNPVGQLGKTLDDTNMESAGQLPAPQKFLVDAIMIDFFPGNSVNMGNVNGTPDNWQDTYDVMHSGHLDFIVGSKSRLKQAPIGAFPPNYRAAGATSVTGSTAAANTISGVDYAGFAGQMFSIIPVTIPANQNFKVTLSWATALPINADARIGVKLMGNLYRSVQ